MGWKKKDGGKGQKTVTLEIQIMEMGDGFLAAARVAGVIARSTLQSSPRNAVAELLRVIGNGNGDADLALELLVSGNTLADFLGGSDPELTP